MLLSHSYNHWLVLVSVLVAILTSYTALDMTGRITASQGRVAAWWLAGGSFAMGVGIWSMHFIGMMAFNLPIAMGYDPGLTFLSMLIAIALSAFALWTVGWREFSWPRLLLGGVLMGLGVASMHYMGMEAMRMTPAVHYDPLLFALSIVIAMGVSGAALWIAFHLRTESKGVRLYRFVAGIVMGSAIAGMHYTAMAGAQFPMGSVCVVDHLHASSTWLPQSVIGATVFILLAALFVSESRTAALATSLANANQELTYLALHDNLTKLPNRLLLEDRIEQAVYKARREHSRFSLMFLDLDGFKAINDAYGHHVGDLLLNEVAQRTRDSIRAQDTLARVGGDEFVLLCSAGRPADAATLAGKLLSLIGKPFAIQGHELALSVSIGIAAYDGNSLDYRDLLTQADAAMYHAKALGGNNYCFFEPSMNANAQQHLQLLHELRLALERQEFVLHYQPKFEMSGNNWKPGHPGRMIGVEALLRWQHPAQNLIPPSQFITMAEKTGLIIPIGEWVLNEACRQMQIWRQAGHKDWSVAVNLSPLQFAHSSLVKTVRDALDRHNLEASCLILEVTESTAMHDVEASMVILRHLHELGVRISIDDFGTGYSSLLYLKRLPASELKIDRGFVRELSSGAEDAAIISAIVGLGRSLHLEVVAEGVETFEQRDFLLSLGCTTMQGFLLGAPMPASQVVHAGSSKPAWQGSGFNGEGDVKPLIQPN